MPKYNNNSDTKTETTRMYLNQKTFTITVSYCNMKYAFKAIILCLNV